MNLKTTLLAGAAVLFAGQAVAADITGALYAPEQGQFTSDTSFTMGRYKTKTKVNGLGTVWSFAEDTADVTEFIEYGVTDQFSINAGINNSFDKEGWYDNEHNFSYEVGAKYTDKIGCRGKYQIAGDYNTWNPKNFFSKRDAEYYDENGNSRRWQKSWGMDFKYGYDLDNGLSWYGIYGFNTDIDTADRDLSHYVTLGLHKYTGKWALDGAVRYEFSTDGKDYYEWWADVAADYYVKENVALGVYGSYLINGKDDRWAPGFGKDESDYAYEYGAHVKVLF